MTWLLAGVFGAACARLAHAIMTAPAVRARARVWKREALMRWRAPLSDAIELLGMDERKVALAQAAGVVLALGVGLAAFAPRLWPVSLPVAGYAAYVLPQAVIRRRVDEYRSAVRNNLADAVEFLDLHFSGGYNVPHALAATSELVTGPLKRELTRVLARVTEGAAPEAALHELGRRAADADVMTVARHVAAAWTVAAPGREVFAGLSDTLRRLEEAQMLARTRKLPTLFSLLVGMGLLNFLIFVGAPVFAWFLATLAQTQGR